MDTHLIDEFIMDWQIAGKSARTAHDYARYIHDFITHCDDESLVAAKTWVAATPSASVRRKRAQALRAFGSWCKDNNYTVCEWWKQIPLAHDVAQPQATATEADYLRAMKVLRTDRDRLLIELLWTTGIRRSELSRLEIRDINFDNGCLVVRQSKNGKPRVVPMSPTARRLMRRVIGARTEGELLNVSSNAVRLMLQRFGLPSAHAWRRGWAVHALRQGVSEASVRAVAGWSSNLMVSHYVRTMKEELAIEEFSQRWPVRHKTM